MYYVLCNMYMYMYMYYVLRIMYYVLCVYIYIYTHTCAVVQLHRINVVWSSINENPNIMGMYQSLLMD